jgi:hypothetical protein
MKTVCMSANDLIRKYPNQCIEIAQRGESAVTHVINLLAYLESRGKTRPFRSATQPSKA